MISLEDALRIVDETLSGYTLPVETIPVRMVVGRTLAEDQVSHLDLPPFNKSAMDGYAVQADDARDSYRVLETVGAGSVPTAQLAPGTAIKVMTGAPVPAGAGRVIKVEDVERRGESILVRHRESDANICLQGEDVRTGDVILRAGKRLTAVDAANLIACGIVEVEVYRPVRLAILATGDEIVDDPRDLAPGKIMNSNGPLLAGLARQHGMEVVREQRVSDEPGATADALRTALAEADLVVFTGGVSVGDFDFVGSALAAAGLKVHFDSVAVKPGRPTTFAVGQVSAVGQVANLPDDESTAKQAGSLLYGQVENLPHAVFGLPGNPVSVYLGFHLFVLRAVARLMRCEPPLREYTLPLGVDFHRRKANRTEYVPARLGVDGRLAPVEFHGSAHLTAMSSADGFFVVPAGVLSIPAGQGVRFLATAW